MAAAIRRSLIRLLLLVSLVLVAQPAPALDPPWLDSMPTAEQIRADIRGSDARDTQARQAVAMGLVADFVASLAGSRTVEDRMTDDEKRIYRTLNDEASRITTAMQAQLDPTGNSPNSYYQWLDQYRQYRSSRQFRDEVYARYFSPALIAQRNETESATRAAAKAQRVYEPDREPREWMSEEWRQMSADDRWGLVAICVLMLLGLGLVIAAELLPFRFQGDDFHKLKAGLGSYRVSWLTGTVRNYDSDEKSATFWQKSPIKVSSSGGPVWEASSSTSLTETFTVEGDGDSQSCKVVSVSSGIKGPPGYFKGTEGNKLSVVSVLPRFGKKPTFIHFQDWTDRVARAPHFMQMNIRGLLGGRHWASLAAWILGIQIGRVFNVPLGPLLGFILCWVAWRLLFNRFRNARVRNFRDFEMPRLRRHIEEEVRAAAGIDP